ncbi:hypothetical protein GCK72_014174 [Caenorhabditis remanei]|uniref:Uncharacterized protein n=1 Tax=Caenorhabditis remanei TaxID=31234 RepID=A0A6A5GQJ5_CAERE|nr:hypothetical protein GCK72_014174 [Caenorhabditis remanei]KAF1757718.1 hypothetical protein GCK72_014174 [Caenorhabditis remanei]
MAVPRRSNAQSMRRLMEMKKEKEKKEEEYENRIPTLAEMCSSSFATTLFRNKIRWRKLTDLAFELRYFSDELKLPKPIQKILLESMENVLAEAKRWDAKHLEMFVEPSKSRRRALPKSELLRTFYSELIWKRDRKQVGDHPVYDFWLTMMATINKDRLFFGATRRFPNQKVAQCFLFAIKNGYYQLVEYIWNQLTDEHREFLGMIEWRNMCYRARDGQAISFLCKHLCELNPVGTCLNAWQPFFDSFQHLIHDEKSDHLERNQYRRKFIFLLKHCCQTLRTRLVKHSHFRLICDAFRYNEQEIFSLLLENMSSEDIASAREYIDRIFDRNKTRTGDRLRRTLIRRQQTVQ